MLLNNLRNKEQEHKDIKNILEKDYGYTVKSPVYGNSAKKVLQQVQDAKQELYRNFTVAEYNRVVLFEKYLKQLIEAEPALDLYSEPDVKKGPGDVIDIKTKKKLDNAAQKELAKKLEDAGAKKKSAWQLAKKFFLKVGARHAVVSGATVITGPGLIAANIALLGWDAYEIYKIVKDITSTPESPEAVEIQTAKIDKVIAPEEVVPGPSPAEVDPSKRTWTYPDDVPSKTPQKITQPDVFPPEVVPGPSPAEVDPSKRTWDYPDDDQVPVPVPQPGTMEPEVMPTGDPEVTPTGDPVPTTVQQQPTDDQVIKVDPTAIDKPKIAPVPSARTKTDTKGPKEPKKDKKKWCRTPTGWALCMPGLGAVPAGIAGGRRDVPEPGMQTYARIGGQGIWPYGKLNSSTKRRGNVMNEEATFKNLKKLLEQDLDQAELALAAKDMVVQLQDIAEDLAKMQVENLMPLVDRIKEEYGPEAGEQFNGSVEAALGSALEGIKGTHEQVQDAVLVLTGEKSAMSTDMGSDDMSMDMGDTDMDDGLGGDNEISLDGEPSAAGPEDMSLGRAVKKESVEKAKRALQTALKEGKYNDKVLRQIIQSMK